VLLTVQFLVTIEITGLSPVSNLPRTRRYRYKLLVGVAPATPILLLDNAAADVSAYYNITPGLLVLMFSQNRLARTHPGGRFATT
jgi:hypothetical protein